MLQVYLSFPERMKMQYTPMIEVPAGTSLNQLRQTIFQILWQPLIAWCPDIEPHGMEGLSLQDRGVAILTDEELYDRILNGCRLQVVLDGPTH